MPKSQEPPPLSEAQLEIMNIVWAIVLWFCPWLHLLNRALSAARESVCDNFVLATRDVADYAHTLLRVGELIAERPPVTCAGMAVSKSSLRRRVEDLLGSSATRETRGAGPSVFGALGVLLALTVFLVRPLTAQAAEAVASKPIPPADAPAMQVMVETKFIEFTNDGAQSWPPESPVSLLSLLSLLDKDAAEALLKKYTSSSGTDVLSAPKVTTLSGQTATIRIGEERFFAEMDETVELGVSFEVTPTVREAGVIDLQMKPQVTEFMGFEKSSKQVEVDGESRHAPVDLPIISTRTVDVAVSLVNGQTAVLGGMTSQREVSITDSSPLEELPLIGGLFRSEQIVSEERVLLVFVTATIVAPDGKPVEKH